MAFIDREHLLSLGIDNIINYLRKSRSDEEYEKRTKENVLKSQKDLMDRVLEPLGLPFDQKTELGSGDKISTRPVFQSVIEDLKVNKYQAIAVKEISRMGRGSYTDMGVIYDLIVDNRIFIITPYRLYDPRNPDDLRQIRFELFMSREEFETTRQRLFGGRISKAIEGKWMGGPAPYGFTKNSKTGRLEINEEQAAVIRTIFDYYVNGIIEDDGTRRDVSFRALATYLERKTPLTTPSGRTNWSPTYVKTLITSERFMGTLKFRTTKMIDGKVHKLPKEEHIICENAVEPIIDLETWEKAQAKVEGSAYKPRTKMDFSPCELAGIFSCAVCGRKMIRQYSVQNYKTQGGSITTYHKEFLWCHTPGCTFVKYRDVEANLLTVLKELVHMDDKKLRKAIVSLLDTSKKTSQTEMNYTEYFQQRSKEIKKRIDFIYNKFESGVYSDEEFKERMALVEKDASDLQELQNRSKHISTAEPDINVDTFRLNAVSMLDSYNSFENKTDKNKLLRSIFTGGEIKIITRGRGRISATFKMTVKIHRSLLYPEFN